MTRHLLNHVLPRAAKLHRRRLHHRRLHFCLRRPWPRPRLRRRRGSSGNNLPGVTLVSVPPVLAEATLVGSLLEPAASSIGTVASSFGYSGCGTDSASF